MYKKKKQERKYLLTKEIKTCIRIFFFKKPIQPLHIHMKKNSRICAHFLFTIILTSTFAFLFFLLQLQPHTIFLQQLKEQLAKLREVLQFFLESDRKSSWRQSQQHDREQSRGDEDPKQADCCRASPKRPQARIQRCVSA